jgi:hypothetical protein
MGESSPGRAESSTEYSGQSRPRTGRRMSALVQQCANRQLARVFLQAWREHDFPVMSQEKFGQRFNPPVDKGTISRWENAKPGHLTSRLIPMARRRHDVGHFQALSDLSCHPSEGRQILSSPIPLIV